MGLPLQQDCSCNCGDPARCRDLGDARDLSRRISFGVLESSAAASSARTFPPVWTSRLRALACIFTGRLAYILACVCWLAFLGDSFGDHHLFCDAVARESGSDTAEDQLIQSVRRYQRVCAPLSTLVTAGADRGGSEHGIIPGSRGQRLDYNSAISTVSKPFANQNASIKVLRFDRSYAFTA